MKKCLIFFICSLVALSSCRAVGIVDRQQNKKLTNQGTTEVQVQDVLNLYSEMLEDKIATQTDRIAKPVARLIEERQSFYQRFFQVALHASLNELNSNYEIRSVSYMDGRILVEAVEKVDFRANYLPDSDLRAQSIYWAEWKVEDPRNKAVFADCFKTLIVEKDRFVGLGFDLSFILEHTLILEQTGDEIMLIQDTYTDENPVDNPDGIDVVKWSANSFERFEPDLMQWPDFEKYRDKIEIEGKIILENPRWTCADLIKRP